jgi:hypothetical protein
MVGGTRVSLNKFPIVVQSSAAVCNTFPLATGFIASEELRPPAARGKRRGVVFSTTHGVGRKFFAREWLSSSRGKIF